MMNQISLIHQDPTIFISSQWQSNKNRPTIKYLLYRTIIMLIFIITWIKAILADGPIWFKYFTNWGYTICTIQAILVFLMISAKKCSCENVLEKLYPLYWMLNIVGTSLAFFITAIYFSVLHDYQQTISLLNYLVHGNNSLLMFIDLLIVAHPMHIPHGVYPVTFGLVYIIFSIIYFLIYPTNGAIYQILDWSKPLVTIGICLSLIGVLNFFHLIAALTSQLRQDIHKKYFNNN